VTAQPASGVRRKPYFLDVGPRRLFVIRYDPPDVAQPRGAVAVMAPFGEEMNRSRRMMTLQAEALARCGQTVFVFDYSGTGDSSGEFADARLAHWIADSQALFASIARTIPGPLAVLCIRLAAPLACALLRGRELPLSRLIFWQPVVSGQIFLTQFLRIRLAADLEAGAGRETTKDLRDRIAAGETLEIAGYEVPAELASAIDTLTLADRAPPSSLPVNWFEIVAPDRFAAGPDAVLAPASRPVVAAWRDAGVQLTTACVPGEPFWATQEIAIAPALIAATTRLFDGTKP